MRPSILLVVFFVAFEAGIAFGIELGMSNIRNPFEFGKGRSETKKKAEPIKKFVPKGDFKLGLIFIKGDKKVALINNKRYKEGTKLGKYVVKSITLHYVELAELADETTTRRLYANEVFR